VQEKDGEDQLGRSCEECRSITHSQGREDILHTIKEGRLTGLLI